MMLPELRVLLLIGLAAMLAVSPDGAAVGEGEADAIIAAIQGARLDSRSAIEITDLRLSLRVATITLEAGVMLPASAIRGRPAEFVFVGSGRVSMTPSDRVDRDQLELFTGASALDEAFDRAVLVLAVDEAVEAILGQPRVARVDEQQLADATELYLTWRLSRERRLLDVEARLFMDAVADRLGGGFFAGFFRGKRLGDFLCVVDLLASEPVTVGQFYRPELSVRQEKRARRHLEKAHRKGKLVGLQLEDLGVWDTWVSAGLPGDDGAAIPGTTGVEARHYTIDATLATGSLDLVATARIELEVLVEGLRTVVVEMQPGLDPRQVRDGDGNNLWFLRSHGELAVLLSGTPSPADSLVLEIDYAGQPLESAPAKAWVQKDSLGWYPHAGDVDRATYDVTLQWPRELDMVACGVLVDEGEDGHGSRWQRRRLDAPVLGFGFEVGGFDIRSERVGDVEVLVAVDRLAQQISADLAAEVLEIVQDALLYLSDVYGPFPYGQLAVVSSPRSLSQGLPGLLIVSDAALVEPDIWSAVLGIEDRRALIAHELAHQWWGNLVGWRSYRDQWISEAMATYSALLYTRKRIRDDDDRVLRGPTSGWMSELLATTARGRTIESLGPPVLGERLASSHSVRAYQSIVYKKGAVVLDMMSRFFDQDVFLGILREIVGAAANRSISTEDFVSLVEHLGGIDLRWFASQYIFGTGLPDMYYSYTIEPPDRSAGGRWLVAGEAWQQAPYRTRLRVGERADGQLDVRSETIGRMDMTGSALMVPIQIGLRPRPGDDDSRVTLGGRTLIQGATSEIRFEIEHEPEVFWLDRGQEVYARFHCQNRWPRRVGYRRGVDLVAAGELERAEAAFRRALTEPVVDVPRGWLELDEDRLERDGRVLEARIRCSLVRLYLDQDRLDQARTELELAQHAVRRSERRLIRDELTALGGRLALKAGRADQAYRSLRKRFGGRDASSSAEGLALLSIAAHATGHDEQYRETCRRAINQGVDLGPLECWPPRTLAR